MRKSVFEKLEEFGFKHASGDSWVACPECDVRIPRPLVGANQVLKCEECGRSASAREWLMHGIESGRIGKADEVPAATRITRKADGHGGTIWQIPASGKFDFFLLFGIFWLGITSVASFTIVMDYFREGRAGEEMPVWMAIPFLGLFWAIGLGVLIAGLRGMFQKTEITVSGGELVLKTIMFGREKRRSCPLEAIKSVSQVAFYSQNKRPVYGIQIKGEKKLRFGARLSDEEKAWLTADIKDQAVGERKSTRRYGRANRGRKDYFSVVIPDSVGSRAIGALMIFGISVLFLVLGLFVMDTGFPASFPAGWDPEEIINFLKDLFSSTFRTLWLGFSMMMACLALYLFFKAIGERGQERRIEGNEAEISLRTYKRGLVLADRSFPRNRVMDIRATTSGTSNNQPKMRVDLILTTEAVKIAGWLDRDEADELVAEVRDALGVE